MVALDNTMAIERPKRQWESVEQRTPPSESLEIKDLERRGCPPFMAEISHSP